jgi:hypothetical protein
MELHRYTKATSQCPFDEWYRQFDKIVWARVTAALNRLSEVDFSSVKSVGAGDTRTGRSMLRDYFPEVGPATLEAAAPKFIS